ncbi:MAG: SDR family oxidoreductase, partial [Desulfovibrionaceae bacterium]
SLTAAAMGCDAAYYLVHSMSAHGASYEELDRVAARNMVQAASTAGLRQIIYLGGLGCRRDALSPHLRSRAEVGDILALGAAPVTILRAAMILGSGSASFEILRYLADRLPVLLAPKWVETRCQPIGIRNVLVYLVECLGREECLDRTFDIGGPDIVTYADLFRIYAQEAGLKKRRIIHAPWFSTTLSAYMVSLLTPAPTPLVKALVEGLSNEVVVKEDSIREVAPQKMLDCRTAIRRALGKMDQGLVDTCCHDAGTCSYPEWAVSGDAHYTGGTLLTCGYRIRLADDAEDVWVRIRRIGGKKGWYFGDGLWRLRGVLDKVIGGVGHRRGRRDPELLRVGDALDFWRVIQVKPPSRLLLMAEMRVAGQALLEFHLWSPEPGVTELSMLAYFIPKGLPGLLYWYGVYPFHAPVFRGMLKRIAKDCGAEVLAGPEKISVSREKPGV